MQFLYTGDAYDGISGSFTVRVTVRVTGPTGADVVVDGSDNFATRHAVNRACVKLGKPLVSGAAVRFDGQVAVFDLRSADSACYGCLFPESGESEDVRCAVMGVFAPLTGIVGSIQAAEALKLLASLTRREREVLALLAKGEDNDGIAQELVISPETARTHVQNVLGKLGVHTRLEAAAFVTQNGILEDLVGVGP